MAVVLCLIIFVSWAVFFGHELMLLDEKLYVVTGLIVLGSGCLVRWWQERKETRRR